MPHHIKLRDNGTNFDILLSEPFSSFQDDFGDNSISGLWNNWGAGNVVEANTQLELSTNAVNGYFGIESQFRYDLTGSNIFLEVKNAGNQALASFQFFPLALEITGDNRLNFFIGNGNIRAQKTVATVVSDNLASQTYNSTTHKYIRIREASGTVYWEYSSNGSSWNILHSESNPFSVKELRVLIMVGTWADEGSATTAIVDNVNVQAETIEVIQKGLQYTVVKNIAITKSMQYTVRTNQPSRITGAENTSGSIGVGFGDTGNGRDYLVQGFIPSGIKIITHVGFWIHSKDGNGNIGYLVWIDRADANSNPLGAAHVGIGGATEITNAQLVVGSLTEYALTTPVSIPDDGSRYVLCAVPWNTTTHAKASSYNDWRTSTGNPYANGRRVHLDGNFANPSAPDAGNADIQFRISGIGGTAKTLRYAVAKAIAVTKGLIYTVWKNNVIQKSLQYEVEESAVDVVIQKSLTYTVAKNISITKDLQYTVRKNIGITKSLSYMVQKSIALTKGLVYTVWKNNQIQKGLTYQVAKNISIGKSLQYSVIKNNQIQKSLVYTIQKSNVIQKGLIYSIALLGSISKGLEYRVARNSVIQKALHYHVHSIQNFVITKQMTYVVQINPYSAKSSPYGAKESGYSKKNSPFEAKSSVFTKKDPPYSSL